MVDIGLNKKRLKVSNVQNVLNVLNGPKFLYNILAYLFVCFILSIVLFVPSLREIIIKSFNDAYVQVASFVALTFLILYLAEIWFDFDLSAILRNNASWQIPLASLFGMIPGCGGAVVMVTQFCRGYLSFGAFVAAMVATMGDAAFLLIAQRPFIALLVIGIQFSTGIISGYVVNKIFGEDFMRPKPIVNTETKQELSKNYKRFHSTSTSNSFTNSQENTQKDFKTSLPNLEKTWYFLIIFGLILGILNAFQLDLSAILSFSNPIIAELILLFGFIAGLLSIFMAIRDPSRKQLLEDLSSNDSKINPLKRIAADTNFIFAWVVLSFLIFEVASKWFPYDLSEILYYSAPILPLFAIFAGFIPGCGPQILITSMYLSNILPLSSQIGNAISNDGDALFPALALAPKQALVATLLSAIPAVIVAYAWFFAFEVVYK